MAAYTGPSRPCADCADRGVSTAATENLGMRLRDAKGDRKLGLFCKDCADSRLGRGPKVTWASLDSKESQPSTPRNDSFAAGHKKNEPEETFYQPTLFE